MFHVQHIGPDGTVTKDEEFRHMSTATLRYGRALIHHPHVRLVGDQPLPGMKDSVIAEHMSTDLSYDDLRLPDIESTVWRIEVRVDGQPSRLLSETDTEEAARVAYEATKAKAQPHQTIALVQQTTTISTRYVVHRGSYVQPNS